MAAVPHSTLMLAVLSLVVVWHTCDAATPVVIDTDVGSVFDDSAAIAVALQSTDLDIKLM